MQQSYHVPQHQALSICPATQKPSGRWQTKRNGTLKLRNWCLGDFILRQGIKLYQLYSWIHMFNVYINCTLVTVRLCVPSPLKSRLIQSPASLASPLPQLHNIASLLHAHQTPHSMPNLLLWWPVYFSWWQFHPSSCLGQNPLLCYLKNTSINQFHCLTSFLSFLSLRDLASPASLQSLWPGLPPSTFPRIYCH